MKSAIKTLTNRSSYRNVTVAINDETTKLYFDNRGNAIYKEIFLEEYLEDDISSTCSSGRPIVVPAQKKLLHALAKDIVINKHSGKCNISPWLVIFEEECVRVGVEESQYPEALHLFLEGLASDWFSLQLKLMDLSDPWQSWKDSIINTFQDKGWTEIKNAINYKYIGGSLGKIELTIGCGTYNDYKFSRIYLVIAGLPNFVSNELPRSNVRNQRDLFKELNQLESLVQKNKNSNFVLNKSQSPSNLSPRGNNAQNK